MVWSAAPTLTFHLYSSLLPTDFWTLAHFAGTSNLQSHVCPLGLLVGSSLPVCNNLPFPAAISKLLSLPSLPCPSPVSALLPSKWLRFPCHPDTAIFRQQILLGFWVFLLLLHPGQQHYHNPIHFPKQNLHDQTFLLKTFPQVLTGDCLKYELWIWLPEPFSVWF